MNLIGICAAAAAFLGIWLGHVAVRRIEFISPMIWLPAAGFAAAGVLLEGLSLVPAGSAPSATLGILGITLLWDAFEITRQERRILSGHAPANPGNSRHAKILADLGSRATTIDLLRRDPVGRLVPQDEAIQLVTEDAAGRP